MRNLQLIEKRVSREGGSLEVFEVFETIQGEGPFAGRPSVFVRLAGCNLQCPVCDTDYTSKRELLTPQDLQERIRDASTASLVVITGGEPFRQDLSYFIKRMFKIGRLIQIETNGTLFPGPEFFREFFGNITIVCSPKTPQIAPGMRDLITHLKYVLSADEVDPTDGLPTSALGMAGAPVRPWKNFYGTVYVQPCDDADPEKNKANTAAAIKSCMMFGYTLCLQLHKMVGLP